MDAGDCNPVKVIAEKLVGVDAIDASEFKEWLLDIDHEDMPSMVFWYTWTTKRGGSIDNKSRIDRVTAITVRMDTFAYFKKCSSPLEYQTTELYCQQSEEEVFQSFEYLDAEPKVQGDIAGILG